MAVLFAGRIDFIFFDRIRRCMAESRNRDFLGVAVRYAVQTVFGGDESGVPDAAGDAGTGGTAARGLCRSPAGWPFPAF